MITISQPFHFTNGTSGRKQASLGERKPKPKLKERVPRISKLMALAIRYDEMLRNRTVCNGSQLARLAHVSQPRMTQIMSLNYLAPDIQEELLFLPSTKTGRERIHEKLLRPITAEMDWQKQRKMWAQLKQQTP